MNLALHTDLVASRSVSYGAVSSSSTCGSNQKSNVKIIRLRSVEQMLTTSSVLELGHRTEPCCVFRSRNVRCQSTNGAANGAPGHANSTTTSSLIGFEAENLIPNSLPKFDDTSSLGQIGVEAVEQLSKVHLEEDSNTLLQGFSTVEEAIQVIKQGKFVLVTDDENRENEGDLIMAGSEVTPEDMAFLVKHGTGIVCVAMKGEDLDRLQLPLMVPQRQNKESHRTAFTVTVDAAAGITTGVSAEDRCKTIRTLASPTSLPEDFVAPGHIFPLRYREGGVLQRRGHTEAALDLALLAGMSPAGILCEVVNEEDGSMARLPYLMKFAKEHGIPIISIDALVKYKIAKEKREVLVQRTAQARLPTKYGEFQVHSYEAIDGLEHAALVAGDISSGLDIYVRVHSECLTGDVFGSTRCDCGSQLAESLKFIHEIGRGVVVYMRGHEGRGIGLGHKMKAYNLQDAGADTVEANLQLGLPVDSRDYKISAEILKDLGVKTITLLSNNPTKVQALRDHGITVHERRSVFSVVTKENRRYIETKRAKMGHLYSSRLPAVGSSSDENQKIESCNSKLDGTSEASTMTYLNET